MSEEGSEPLIFGSPFLQKSLVQLSLKTGSHEPKIMIQNPGDQIHILTLLMFKQSGTNKLGTAMTTDAVYSLLEFATGLSLIVNRKPEVFASDASTNALKHIHLYGRNIYNNTWSTNMAM